jgi:uncharacterized protein YdaU (DUF1376 family)
MAALPYMPLYVADYLADAAHLTTIQHGAYLLLIMNYWQRGEPLANDDARLARIVGLSVRNWQQIKGPVVELFDTGLDFLTHPRIERELDRVKAKSLKCKKAGLASVERRLNTRSTPAEQTFNHTDTDTRKEEEVTPAKTGRSLAFEGKVIRLSRADFENWRKAYPKIDLLAALQSRDDWLAAEADEKTRKKWFLSTSNHLANLQQKARSASYDPDRITV